MKSYSLIIVFLLSLVVSACQLAPEQQVIELPLPNNYALVTNEGGSNAA